MRTAGSHDHRQWVLLVLDQFEGRLLGFAVRLLGDQHLARDVVQHVFLRLCDASEVELGDRLKPWLFTVCRNKAMDHLRQRQAEGRLTDEEAAEPLAGTADPAFVAEQADLHACLRQSMDRLPVARREALALWCEGFTYREIAAMTHAGEGNVRVLVHRALEQLREQPLVRQFLPVKSGEVRS